MKEGFIDFTHLQLNEASVTSAVAQRSADDAKVSGQAQREGTDSRRAKQGFQMAAKTGSPTQATNIQKNVAERLLDIRTGKEVAKLYEETKSDWRKEISEELADDPNEPEHPYIKVMPHIQYKQHEAEKQIKAAAKVAGAEKEIKNWRIIIAN